MQTILAFTVLAQLIIILIVYGYRKSNDHMMLAILIGATALRIAVGFINMAFGPLPGAEVDAVLYETHASNIAREFAINGNFIVEVGRLGYSTILAPFYVVAGSFEILPTFVNLLFTLHFITLVYLIARELGTQRQARLAAMLAAFYPTAVLYTSVPLREAPLLWGLALWMYGIILYMNRKATLFNWRVLLGFMLPAWLHTGFFLLGMLTPAAWYLRGKLERQSKPKMPGGSIVRLGVVGLGVILVFFSFLRFGGQISGKLPDDPSEVTSLQYINQARAYKSSYGTGYVGYAPTSGGNFIATLPVVTFRFLFSPTPMDVLAAGGSPAEALKMLDSLAFLVMVGWSVISFRNARRANQTVFAMIIGGTLIMMVLLFSIGTANVGIAIRHRAKFAWIFTLLIALWGRRQAEATEAVEEEDAPEALPLERPTSPLPSVGFSPGIR